jgi:hypothetical protein
MLIEFGDAFFPHRHALAKAGHPVRRGFAVDPDVGDYWIICFRG